MTEHKQIPTPNKLNSKLFQRLRFGNCNVTAHPVGGFGI